QRYEDKQTGTQTVTPAGTPVGRIINAGKANIDGFEADIQWRVTQNLTLGLGYSFLDAKYTDFKFRSNSATDAIRYADCERVAVIRSPTGTITEIRNAPVPAQPPGTVVNFFCDIDALKNRSLKLEDVPEHSLVFQARYERPVAALGGSRWYIEGDSQVQTERFIDPSNRRFVEDYVLANLRIGLMGEDRRWEAMIYVNNLFDDDTILSAQDQPGEVDSGINTPNAFGPTDGLQIQLPDPRIIGLRFNWRFGGR
ncbi:MAG: TonB-dependent receptor, partial [Steroidobacteraceae bacterium]|nr:TonB-dependent receptor [Steroidobacteraceae bacterium]